MKKTSNKKYTYFHPKNKEVGDNLEYRDRLTIQAKTGYSYRYVCEVLAGKRNNQDIIEAAKQLIELKRQFVNS